MKISLPTLALALGLLITSPYDLLSPGPARYPVSRTGLYAANPAYAGAYGSGGAAAPYRPAVTIEPDSPASESQAPSDEDENQAGKVVDGYYEKNWLVWEELVPPDWKPEKIIEDLKLNEMSDNDPRAEAALEEFLKRWNEAPVNRKMDNRPVKIPGFVVPLDFDRAEIDEFLLVPYFGACIHVPPPPPNQIVHVRTKKPIEGLAAMDVVWVYGKIRTDRFKSELGSAGYTIGADRVEIYREGQ
ncbi:MAG: DUF3299 domain-containing protein [Deltaproteobacteria bacterium]|jgi:hypothetical protein|nr:DUF3299 domain-containing protein [Deltaproteobacteria bacterium]